MIFIKKIPWCSITEPDLAAHRVLNIVSARKWRLFMVACCYAIKRRLHYRDLHDAILTSELYADRRVRLADLRASREDVSELIERYDGNVKARGRQMDMHHVRRCCDRDVRSAAYYFVNKERIINRKRMLAILHDIIGDPDNPQCSVSSKTAFRSIKFQWVVANNHLAGSLAREAYDKRDFSNLPIIADALEEAGCDNTTLLAHLREDREHWRGCWAVDLILGRH